MIFCGLEQANMIRKVFEKYYRSLEIERDRRDALTPEERAKEDRINSGRFKLEVQQRRKALPLPGDVPFVATPSTPRLSEFDDYDYPHMRLPRRLKRRKHSFLYPLFKT